jgi:hypothetical protein
MTQHQGTLGWSPHIGSHPNVPWCCVIVVHKECNDYSPLLYTTLFSYLADAAPLKKKKMKDLSKNLKYLYNRN